MAIQLDDPQLASLPRLLRPSEVAHVLGLSRGQAYKLISTGEIKSIRIGGSVRVDVEDLTAFLDERRGGNGEAA